MKVLAPEEHVCGHCGAEVGYLIVAGRVRTVDRPSSFPSGPFALSMHQCDRVPGRNGSPGRRPGDPDLVHGRPLPVWVIELMLVEIENEYPNSLSTHDVVERIAGNAPGITHRQAWEGLMEARRGGRVGMLSQSTVDPADCAWWFVG